MCGSETGGLRFSLNMSSYGDVKESYRFSLKMTWPMCSLLLPQLKAMSPGWGLQFVGGCILGQRSHLLLAEGPPVHSTIIQHHNSRRLWVSLPLNKPELYIQETVLLLSASVLSIANIFLRRDTLFFFFFFFFNSPTRDWTRVPGIENTEF